ncbi:TPA: hypothetical protein I7783_21490, partial [Vibrio vulnificus]|nr:hypothetical protein [Vibrio vulnificus]
GEVMEIKDLLPILGVALGWGLSELGGFMKNRAARARTIKQAIATLYKLNFDMLQVKRAQEYYKSNAPSDLATWERGRQRSFQKHLNFSEKTLGKINESVSLISQEYPLLAFRLDGAISAYTSIINSKLDSAIDNKDLYMTMLGKIEVSQLASQAIVEKTIFTLAFRVDFLLWVSLKLDMRKFKQGINKGDLVHSSQVFRGKKT